MTKTVCEKIMPPMTWVGGKRRLLKEYDSFFPSGFGTYCEPFVGGGAVLFHLLPQKAVINDLNPKLINVYKVIRDNMDEPATELSACKNEKKFYYSVRNMDRNHEQYAKLSKIKKAARMIYLTQTSFNGLYRVNGKGECNMPYGISQKKTSLSNLYKISRYLRSNEIIFMNADYKKILPYILETTLSPQDTFMYLDPPYAPVKNKKNIIRYNKENFGKKEHLLLKKFCDELTKYNIKFMLSNSATKFILNLYADYDINFVKINRLISRDKTTRGNISETVIRNYC